MLTSTRLALQSAVTLGCAWRLLARLRAADPMAGRVALTKADFAAALRALFELDPQSPAAVAVPRSGDVLGALEARTEREEDRR